ncbi:kelch repeat-containing protein [Aquimarina sp. MMG016]|uniref:kelch repeat-containing protein n=1 Tax=Aquimarina sp. MMG016 TaxID=2822690 RepID=UPI001B39E459|nr:kelch repeat-containing protein [Aquimarina sp. MMG016]MBQ4822132.1 hypothetical protein [Aquimarina sp. MMG016]
MKKLVFNILIFVSFLFASCDNDTDDPSNPGIEIAETIQLLTDNSSKSWSVSKALIINPNKGTSLDISNESNIKDDVFIFSTTIVDNPNLSGELASVIWKRREAVNWNATTNEELYKDFYEKELVLGITISNLNPDTFIGFEGLFDFTVVSENKIIGRIRVGDFVEMEITLIPYTDSNAPVISNSLEFKEIGFYGIDGIGIGMTSSNQSNSLIISRRGDFDFSICDTALEEIITYDVVTNEFVLKPFCQPSGFFNKEPEIVNGKLIVVASNTINTYQTSLTNNPTSISNNFTTEIFSRHKTASYDTDIFIVGSMLNTAGGGDTSEFLFKYNTVSQNFDEVARLPEPVFYADAEIVDDKLYIFGGSSKHIGEGAIDTISIYDLNTGEWQSSSIPKAVNATFTDRYQNLIYVGGYREIDGGVYESFLGVFNTTDESFTEISMESDMVIDDVIRELKILNNKLYLVTGAITGGSIKIYEAELN